MIVAQVSIAPLGSGKSVSKYVKIAVDTLDSGTLRCETNAMATVIEAESLEDLFALIRQAHTAVLDAGAQRVITEIKIDDRIDKKANIKSKLQAIDKA